MARRGLLACELLAQLFTQSWRAWPRSPRNTTAAAAARHHCEQRRASPRSGGSFTGVLFACAHLEEETCAHSADRSISSQKCVASASAAACSPLRRSARRSTSSTRLRAARSPATRPPSCRSSGGRPTTRRLRSIAAENNLSEAAFIVPAGCGSRRELRAALVHADRGGRHVRPRDARVGGARPPAAAAVVGRGELRRARASSACAAPPTTPRST